MTGLWIPAAINLAGVRQMAWFQNLTVVLKFLPLLFVGSGRLVLRHSRRTSAPFNATGGSLYDGIGIAAGVALFSFIGVECASIAAGRVKNPRRNVGRASIFGTAPERLALPAGHRRRHGSRSPRQARQRRRALRGRVPDDVQRCRLGRQARCAHRGDLRHRCPERLDPGHGRDAVRGRQGRTLPRLSSPRSTGRRAVVRHPRLHRRSLRPSWASSYSGKTGLKVFTYLVYLSVVTVAIPYFFSACAQLAYLVSRRRKVNRAGCSLVTSRSPGTSLLFSLWVTFASGYQAVYQAMVLFLIGIPLYAFLKARKERSDKCPSPSTSREAGCIEGRSRPQAERRNTRRSRGAMSRHSTRPSGPVPGLRRGSSLTWSGCRSTYHLAAGSGSAMSR